MSAWAQLRDGSRRSHSCGRAPGASLASAHCFGVRLSRRRRRAFGCSVLATAGRALTPLLKPHQDGAQRRHHRGHDACRRRARTAHAADRCVAPPPHSRAQCLWRFAAQGGAAGLGSGGPGWRRPAMYANGRGRGAPRWGARPPDAPNAKALTLRAPCLGRRLLHAP